MKNLKILRILLVFVAILQSLSFVNGRKLQKINFPALQLSGYVNQSKSIPLPFKRCFQAEAQAPSNNKYLIFKPSSLSLQKTKTSVLQKTNELSLLENLRTPISYRHKNMLVFDKYVLLFMAPKKVVIAEENEGGFSVKHEYQIEELDYYTHFKIYKYRQQAVILLGTKFQALILNEVGYSNYQLSEDIKVSHFQELPGTDDQFITAEYDGGFGHYKVDRDNKKIVLLKRFNQDFFKQDRIYLVDFTTKLYNQGKIYFLDEHNGVFEVNFLAKNTKNQTSLPNKNNKPGKLQQVELPVQSNTVQTQDLDIDGPSQPQVQADPRQINISENASVQLIIEQVDCQALDALQSYHFVLVCRMGGSSYIVEAFEKKTPNGQKVFKKVQPSFHQTYFNDISVSGEYYLVFSHKAVNVFWNSKESGFTQLIQTQTQLNLPGLETFFMASSDILYAVQSGILNKYSIHETAPELLFKSPQPMSKSFKVFLYGLCSQIPEIDQQKMDRTCQVSESLNVQILEEVITKPDVSISASIIIILIVVLLVVIWICLKKYQSLEKEARKVLEAYKKKKPTQKFVF